MIYGLYNSAAGMLVNEYRQDVIANNLANADTAGFKRDIAVFAERLPAREAGVRDNPSDPLRDPYTGGLWQGQTLTDFGTARMTRTGRNLDIAIEGPGFFVVQTDGQEQVTRDGRFVVNAAGQLVSSTDGAPVMGVGGVPIIVNPVRTGMDQLRIDADGRVLQDGAQVGQLALVDFAAYDDLRKVGDGRWATNEAEAIPSPGRLQGGFVEGSGVEPVQELVGMMTASRSYQLNAQMLTMQDQSVGRLISVIAAI